MPTALASDLPDLFDPFKRHLEAENASAKTVLPYLAAVHKLDAFLADRRLPRRIDVITRGHVEAYLAWRRTTPGRKAATVSPATLNQDYRSLQQFFRSGRRATARATRRRWSE
jgi:hypothetical protein